MNGVVKMEENCILTNFVINFKGDDVTRYELLFSIDLVPCQKIWPLCEAGRRDASFIFFGCPTLAGSKT